MMIVAWRTVGVVGPEIGKNGCAAVLLHLYVVMRPHQKEYGVCDGPLAVCVTLKELCHIVSQCGWLDGQF